MGGEALRSAQDRSRIQSADILPFKPVATSSPGQQIGDNDIRPADEVFEDRPIGFGAGIDLDAVF